MTIALDLAQRLIAISSFRDDQPHEGAVVDFLEDYFRHHLPWLELERQPTGTPGRDNLIAFTDRHPRLLLGGHLDTVPISSADQLIPTIRDGSLYGLGAVDMKSGLATVIATAQQHGPGGSYAILCYVDEEFDFAGMRTFIASSWNTIRPELICIAEPTDLSILAGCRGLIEFRLRVFGQRGHAARPQSGVNAIAKAMELMKLTEFFVAKHVSPEGIPSAFNLASIDGGAINMKDMLQNDAGQLLVSRQGNVIPDVAEVVVDIRPATPLLNQAALYHQIMADAQTLGVQAMCMTSRGNLFRHDLPGSITPRDQLGEVEQLLIDTGLPVTYTDISTFGYTDAAMAGDAFQVPAINFGPGPRGASHQKDEHVCVADLAPCGAVYDRMIRHYA